MTAATIISVVKSLPQSEERFTREKHTPEFIKCTVLFRRIGFIIKELDACYFL